MHLYGLTAEQLSAVSEQLKTVLTETKDEYPLAAVVIVDAMKLVAQEMLVRVVGGDRALAAKLAPPRRGN